MPSPYDEKLFKIKLSSATGKGICSQYLPTCDKLSELSTELMVEEDEEEEEPLKEAEEVVRKVGSEKGSTAIGGVTEGACTGGTSSCTTLPPFFFFSFCPDFCFGTMSNTICFS